MKRKDFLHVTARSLLGMGFMAHWPFKNPVRGETLVSQSAGGAMLEVKTKRLFLQHTWTISRNSSDYKDNVFVKLTHDGVTGYGEAAPNIRYGEDQQLTTDRINSVRNLITGYDLWQFAELKNEIFKAITDQNCARCALDMAIMDWIGKKLNVPLYRFLGADKNKTAVTSFTIGIDTPEVIKQKIREAEQYPILKIKVGRENDEEIMDTVRSVTDKVVRVDANEGWKTKEVALQKIKWLKTMGVEFVEQPLPAEMLEETKWVRSRVDMPLIADEAVKTAADIPKLAEAYDGINIKLMKAGGIQESWRMIQLAKAMNLKIMLGCMIESSVAIAAAAHLTPFVDWADLDGNLLIKDDPFSGLQIEKGKIILNDQPGLGISGDF
jgi:L-Ala-D/L-Glu epimerase